MLIDWQKLCPRQGQKRGIEPHAVCLIKIEVWLAGEAHACLWTFFVEWSRAHDCSRSNLGLDPVWTQNF